MFVHFRDRTHAFCRGRSGVSMARPVVVDVGTGCGAVALSIADSLRSSRIWNDISDVAARRGETAPAFH